MKIIKDDYIVYFKGAKLNKKQAKQVGFTLACGILTAIVVALTIGELSSFISKAIVITVGVIAFIYSGSKVRNK